jgi:sec-independent protein translocase protein TatC
MQNVYPDGSNKLDFISHLEELRRRILYSLAALAIAAIGFFWKAEFLMAVVIRPIHGLVDKLIFISPTEAFAAYVKVAFLGSLVVTFPYILYQVWAFLSPAFSKELRPRIALWLFGALFLFFAGIAFSYFLAIPAALKFLLNFAGEIATPSITLGKYVSFFGALELVGGIIFLIPIIMGLAADLGVIKASFLRKKRPHAVIVILIFAAVITPTQDIFNMLLFAMPMLLLYEAGLILTTVIERRKT